MIDIDKIVGIIVGVVFFAGFVLMISFNFLRADQQLKIYEQQLNQKIAVEQLAKRMR